MPLPSRMVDAIFTRLLVRYGTAWSRMWEGIPLDAIKSDWANELDGMTGPAMSYALENLPADYPPSTAKAFKALALNMPVYVKRVALDRPKANPEKVAEIMAKLSKAFTPGERDRFEWAYALQEREKNGENLTEAERSMWRAALEVAPIDEPVGFTPIANELLPPGMQKGAQA